MPCLSEILGFREVNPRCRGTCNPPSKSNRRHRQWRCDNKLSATTRFRITQVLDTGSAIYRAGMPLQPCLEQLAPLVLCVRDHQGQAQQLMKDWWQSIVEQNDGHYWTEMVGAYRDMGYLEELDGDVVRFGGDEVKEDGEEEEEEEGRNGSTSTSTSSSTVTSTAASTVISLVSTSTASLASVDTSSSSASDRSSSGTESDRPSSNFSSLLSRLRLAPQRPKKPKRRSSHYTIGRKKRKDQRDRKANDPLSVVRASVAKLYGLGPNHVLPKLPVWGECKICLLDFDALGGSDAEYTAVVTPPKYDGDASKKQMRKRNKTIATRGGDEKQKKTEVTAQPQASGPEDPWSEYDFKRWIWCKGSCGTSFHKECLGQWIDTSRYAQKPNTPCWPTCPTCRMHWVY